MEKHPRRIEHPDQPFVYVGDKSLKKVQKAAWNAGWWPSRKSSGMLWLAPDEVGQVMLHATSSDRHALANAISRFRNAGLDI